MDLGPFWRRNELALKGLERSRMPARSRLVYKDVAVKRDKARKTYSARYDLVNFYDNRKNLLRIIVQFSKDLTIKGEEIVARNGLSGVRKTTLQGSRVTSPGHIAWLRNMTKRMAAGDALR